MRNTISVTIMPKHADFLKKNNEINVSQLLQLAIDRVMGTPTREELDNLEEELKRERNKTMNWKEFYYRLLEHLREKYPQSAKDWEDKLMDIQKS